MKNPYQKEAEKAEEQGMSSGQSPPDRPTPPHRATTKDCHSTTSWEPETGKQVKNPNKQLQAIEQLREAAPGKRLEKHYSKKMQQERAFLQELEDTDLGI